MSEYEKLEKKLDNIQREIRMTNNFLSSIYQLLKENKERKVE